MKDFLLKLYVKYRILRDEAGQDLIEYTLTAALIAMACTAGMGTVATAINTAFGTIGTYLGTYVK